MNRLAALEANSVFILREAFNRVKPLGMLWSLGKDSNVLLWLVRKAFFGNVPFPVVLLDTGNELDEVYAFRDRYVKEWNLSYINAECPPIEETDPSLAPMSRAAARKTLGLERLIEQHSLRGILLGIRRDEQAIRSKERIFSPRDANGKWDFRNQPPELWDQFKSEVPNDAHIRIHPLLAWTELDIWRYIEQEGIPVVSLYFAETASVTARSARKTSHSQSPQTRAQLKKSLPSSKQRASRSAPAAEWTMSARMRSKLCVLQATCKSRSFIYDRSHFICDSAQDRCCGSRRSWKIDDDRPLAVRNRRS